VNAVETRGLVKVYGGRRRVEALRGVDLEVPSGVVFGLFGPNGAGKSTLLSILVGLVLPTRGEARVLGMDAVRQSVEVRRRVGVLPEGFGFYEHLSGLENLVYLGMLDGMRRSEAEERARRILGEVGLGDAAEMPVKGYSRGMRQRLGVAQAVMKNPDLVLFDEPTQGIDPEGVAWFKEYVSSLRRSGKTVVISTHLLGEVGTLCSHAALIYRGRILVQGEFTEIARRVAGESEYRAVAVFPNTAMAEAAHKALAGRGVEAALHAERLYFKLGPGEAEEALREAGLHPPPVSPFPVDWADVFFHYLRHAERGGE